MSENNMNCDWSPFSVGAAGERSPKPRSILSLEGIGDRLRAAAFAERQARDAFTWAAGYFEDAPAELKACWLEFAQAENRHLDLLMVRMKELDIDPSGRPVSTRLWGSLMECVSARDFAVMIARAEERGRQAGCRVAEKISESDPQTAEIFRRIAQEEVEHVDLVRRFYPEEAVV